jgi:hypothetical protein
MSFEEVEKRMMDNKTRAMYLKLQKYLPSGGKVTIHPAAIAEKKVEWRFEWIKESENEIRLHQNEYRSISVPISFIEDVWNGNPGICLKLNTRIFCNSDILDFVDSENVEIYKDSLAYYSPTYRKLHEH